MLMKTVKLHGEVEYDIHMIIHTSAVNKDTSLEREYQEYLSNPLRKDSFMDQVK